MDIVCGLPPILILEQYIEFSERSYNMINSGVFDYVNVLSKAADAAWERNELLVNNYSNANTPGYKRKDLD